jgi:hypothetical protein
VSAGCGLGWLLPSSVIAYAVSRIPKALTCEPASASVPAPEVMFDSYTSVPSVSILNKTS